MGSGGGGSTQNTTQEFKPPEWTVPGWQALLNGATTYAAKPHQPYDGMKVAPINGTQSGAFNFIEDRATNGAPDLNAARGMAMNMSQGNYANPWAQNLQGLATGQGANPWAKNLQGLASGQGANPYTSDEYMNAMIGQNAEDMGRAYAAGDAANLASAANMAGSYGGGGHQAMQAAGLAGLQKSVGNMAGQVRAQQQQYKGQMYNQDVSNMMGAIGMGGGMYNQDVSNMVGAIGMGGGMYGQDVNAMLQGGQLAGQLSQDDWKAGSELMNSGTLQNQYLQQLLNSQFGEWQNAQQYPAQMLDILGNALGRSSGSYGTNLASGSGPGVSPWTAAAGLGTAAYGLLGK